MLATRGLVLFLSGRLPQALQHVQSALRLDPGHEMAMKLRKRVKEVERLKEEGNNQFKSNAFDDAIEKYTAAIDVRHFPIECETAGLPNGFVADWGKGRGSQGWPDTCNPLIKQGNHISEGGHLVRSKYTTKSNIAHPQLHRYDEALKDTDESIALYPGNFKTLRTRARIYLHLENFEASVVEFKAALEQAKFEDSVTELRSLQTELKKAEAALKRSKTKDYYKILGVSRDCTDAELKKAYRKESLTHHPDKGGDEEKFKLANEAFSVLSDPQRRQRYDLGEDDSEYGGGSGNMGAMSPQDFAELFAQFGGGGPGGGFNFHSSSRGGGYPF